MKTEDLQERFSHELWPLNEAGNSEYALSELVRACSQRKTVSGENVTFDLILKKYQEYMGYIKAINNEREPKYHTKPDDIGKFISSRRYNESFQISTNESVDFYLYGT